LQLRKVIDMFARKFALAVSLSTAGIGTAFADAHTVTFAAKPAALGATITLAGQAFVMIRVPFRTFTGDKYYIFAPAPVEDPFGGALSVSTSHDTKAFSPNININNVPARVSVQDTRTYSVSGDIGTDAQFVVQAGASIFITFKIGDTLVSLGTTVGKPPGFASFETQADVGSATNLVPFAAFATYTDLPQQVKAVNDYIDYIRIVAIP
jgi:hypothetical protein